ncbi:MAG: prephenate dehydratase [Bacteroidota bacterium]
MLSTDSSSTSDLVDSSSKRRVCIQGYAGAFHEIAARHCFQAEEIEVVPAHTFDDLVGMIEKGVETDLGLMAIENTLAGSLMYNYNLLNSSQLAITGEVFLRIKQNLLALPGTRIEELEEVHSHPIAIAQCRAFFRQYPHIRLVETVDTALAAKRVRNEHLTKVGAIASTLAGDIYDMEVLAGGIETNKKNHTRFLVLERKVEVQMDAAANKVSLCFSIDHEVGSLYKILSVLAAYHVNLTKIQSAPIIGQPWEYLFFVDFVAEGKVGCQQAIDAIRPITHNLHVMGVYHKGQHFDY